MNPQSMMRRWLACAAACIAATGASAQSWPTKPITLVVPFAPGASADGIARIAGRELSSALGQPVVVENRPGAGGATGLIAVSKANADGYTIGLGATGAIAVNPHVPDSPPLKPSEHLQPLAKLADIPLVLISGANTGILTLQTLIEKAKSAELSTGNTGVYSSQHLATELLASMAKIRLSAVPYRGSAPAVTDVLGGQIPLAMVDLTSAAPHIKTGAARALAVTSPARTKIAQEIPTMEEAGVPGYSATAWMGLFAPKDVPPAIVDRIGAELSKALAKPEVQNQILALSAEPAYLDGKQFETFIDIESRKWAQLISVIPKPSK